MENTILITLCILLFMSILSILILVCRKRDYLLLKRRNSDEVWNDFVLINSTEHMEVIKMNNMIEPPLPTYPK